jgi:hypothetical protein
MSPGRSGAGNAVLFEMDFAHLTIHFNQLDGWFVESAESKS